MSGFHATMRIGCSQFSHVIVTDDCLEQCRKSAVYHARKRLTDSAIGMAEVVIFRDYRRTPFDNKIVEQFIVMKPSPQTGLNHPF